MFFAQDISRESGPLFYETSFDTMQLINLFRKGDEKAVNRVNHMLDTVEMSGMDECVRRYALFRLLEYLRTTMQKAGINVDERRFATIAGLSKVTQQHDAIETLIREVISSQCTELALKKDTLEREMIAYVESHYCNGEFCLEMLAERFDMNPSAASRLFKEVVGINFTKYINGRRIDQAKFLLGTTREDIAEIAIKTGFSSASYFGKVFKTSEGVTPAAYREKHTAKD